MHSQQRRRMVTPLIPLVIALAAGTALVKNLRLVDFLAIFATGAVFGVSLKALIDASRQKKPQGS